MNSEPAFPCTIYGQNSIGEMVIRDQCCGITKREYFAAHATEEDIRPIILESSGEISRQKARYIFADRMISGNVL